MNAPVSTPAVTEGPATRTAAHKRRASRHWQAGTQAARKGQWSIAAREFGHAASLAPDDAGAAHDLAVSLARLGRFADATVPAQLAFDLLPANPQACKTLADCLVKQNRHAEAAATVARLPAAVERTHDLLLTEATALVFSKRPGEAIPLFLKALSLDLTSHLAHYRMGLAFKGLGQETDANLCFQTALATDKTGALRPLILSQLVYGSRLAGEWDQIEAHTAALLKAIDDADDETGAQISPFTLLAVDTTPAQQLRVGRLAIRAESRHIAPLPEGGPGLRRPGRIRLGYLSADFCNHATALLMTELLEGRDSERFEVFLYSHSPQDHSTLQQRVCAAADHYLDVTAMADSDVAHRMRADGIDIAIDLKGHSRDTRFQLLAYRPAPVQVAYIGFPGTTGADFIDYLIGDAVVTPLSHASHFSEHIAQLPHSYQPNDRKRVLPPKPARAAEGLPEAAVVLCCFNQTYKISPHMLDLWARILAGAPNTVLWLLNWTPNSQVKLAQQLRNRQVDLDRVFFAPRVSVEDHMARFRCADLFLDTWPCNAHTTASEALWAGVPVLTVPGLTYASRVAASLVAAVGQPEMACADEESYVQTAIRLAQTPAELRALQTHLDANRMTLPLFDSARYTRDYEALLRRMFERRQAGLAPTALASVSSEAAATVSVAAAAPASTVAVARSGLRVHLVVMQPPGHLAALGYIDPARYLRHQLRRLGAEVTIAKNRLRADAINIVFGAHLGFPVEWTQRHTCLFFNLETLGRGGTPPDPAYLELLRRGAVIDGDADNIACYRVGRHEVPVLPILHAPYLKAPETLRLEDRPIDLLFFGELNPRRLALIARIESTGVNVTAFDHPLYGEERDRFILQAKAVLNCHLDEGGGFEQVRVAHCLSLGTPVIAERGARTAPHAAFEDAVTWVSETQWESFFRERFAGSDWFDAARRQVDIFTRKDAAADCADLLAHARRLYQEQRSCVDTRPWQPALLNLGAAQDYKQGWLNLDPNDRAEPDLVLDLGQALALPIVRPLRHGGEARIESGQFDRIYANNVFEHVPDLPTMMGNALALLTVGGTLEIEVPCERALLAGQDPVPLRALNENAWLHYTDWFWYLGWFEERFELVESTYLNAQLARCAKDAAVVMKITLRKVVTTPYERTLARSMQPDLHLPEDRVEAELSQWPVDRVGTQTAPAMKALSVRGTSSSGAQPSIAQVLSRRPLPTKLPV